MHMIPSERDDFDLRDSLRELAEYAKVSRSSMVSRILADFVAANLDLKANHMLDGKLEFGEYPRAKKLSDDRAARIGNS